MKEKDLMGGLVCASSVFPSQEYGVCVCRNFVWTGCSVCEFQTKYCWG